MSLSRNLQLLCVASAFGLGACPIPLPEVDGEYACATGADCVEPYVCDLVTLKCALPGVVQEDAGRVVIVDAGPGEDAGLVDGGTDAGVPDAGVDAGPLDSGADAGLPDAGLPDAGLDGGIGDAGLTDAGLTDAGVIDAGVIDAGLVDAGLVDAGPGDAGPGDAGFDGGVGDAGPGPCLYSCVDPLVCDANAARCVEPLCGNGRVDVGEECDDGDRAAGDGCDGACAVEPSWSCFGEPSVCAPPGSAVLHADGNNLDVQEAIAAVAPGQATWIFVGADYGSLGGGSCGGGDEQLVIDGKIVYLVGDGSTFISPSSNAAGIHILGNAYVEIHGFEISNRCNATDVIHVESATLVVEDSEVHGQGVGVRATNDATVTLRRNRIHHNTDVGLFLDTSRYRVESCFIYRNGISDRTTPGVSLQRAPANASFFFRFNTVVLNRSTGSAGVYCNDNNTPLHACIVRGNGMRDINSDKCQPTSSSIGGLGDPLDVNPRFVDLMNDDFHLAADSPLIDQVPAGGPLRDIDYDARPWLGAYDVGADEVPE